MLEALGMALVAEEMDGLSQPLRTLYVEHVRSLVVYNIIGDRLQYPDGTGGGLDGRPPPSTLHLLLGSRDPTSHIPYPDPTGMRSARFGGFAAQNMLAFISDASARKWVRRPPRRSSRRSTRHHPVAHPVSHPAFPTFPHPAYSCATRSRWSTRGTRRRSPTRWTSSSTSPPSTPSAGTSQRRGRSNRSPSAWTGPIRCATRWWWRWRGGRRAGRALGTGERDARD